MKVASTILRWMSLAASAYHLLYIILITLPTMLLVYIPMMLLTDLCMIPFIIVPLFYIPMVVMMLIPVATSVMMTVAAITSVVKTATNKPDAASGVILLAISAPFSGTPFFNGILLIVWSALRKRIIEKENAAAIAE